MSKPLRVAFIGAGGIAQFQMNYLSKIEGAEVVAAADVSEKALAKAAETCKIPRTFGDYEQMLREVKEIEAVSVCTPNGLHCANTVAALKAGKHVMVEKPMAMTAAEGQQMLDAAKKAGKQLIVGFQSRFDPKTKLVRDQISAGTFGNLLYVRAQALRRRGIPNWGVFGRKDLQGGGPMIDIGVHILETAHYMMGSPRPVTVTGNTWTYLGNRPSEIACAWPGWDHANYSVEDLAVGMIRFENGAMLAIEASFVAHIEKDVWNINLMGERAGANWDASQIFTDQGGYMMNMTPGYLGKWDPFEYKMKHFVEVCRDGRKNESPGEHGLLVQKMLDGVYMSSATGKEVRIE